MTSDKAIQKIIDNGFSKEEHLKAVLDIKRLFENAKLAQTHKDNKGLSENVLIHRLNSELENANALITTKESIDINKNKIYSLELELTPRFNNSSTLLNTKISEGGFNSQKGHQEQTIKAEPPIAKTDKDIIPQETQEITESNLQKEMQPTQQSTQEIIKQTKNIESNTTDSIKDLIFTDKKGKEHTLIKEVQQ